MLFKISNSFFYSQKVAYIFCAKASNFNPLEPDLLTLYRRPNPIKILPTYAVPPTTTLNIRPVESGIIPDNFSTGWKTDPAHYDLSERVNQPHCILDQHTLSLIKDRSLPIRQFFQSGIERGLSGSLVWTGLKILRTSDYTLTKTLDKESYKIIIILQKMLTCISKYK